MNKKDEKNVGLSKFRLFKDTVVTDPNKYKIDKETKIIIPDWGIVEPGTLDKSEYLNEMQYNDLYKVIGIRREESGQEIYTISIPGAELYETNFDANLLFCPDSVNTTANPKIKYKNSLFVIKHNEFPILAGDLQRGAMIGIRLNNSNFEAEIFSITQRTFSILTRNNPGLVPASGTTGSSRTLMENGVWGCPTPVGGLLFLTQKDNPNTIYSGTTWEQLKGYYLKCTSDSEKESGITGGKNEKTISVSNLPAHKHEISQTGHIHSVTVADHNHNQEDHAHFISPLLNGEFEKRISKQHGYVDADSKYEGYSIGHVVGAGSPKINPYTSKNGGDPTKNTKLDIDCSSNNANITINNTGSGTEFNVEPSYYTVNTWKRLS